jgi:deoxyribonuclease I
MKITRNYNRLLASILTAIPSPVAYAGGQHIIPDYATAQRQYFWTRLYVNGGKELYCNVPFTKGQRVSVEHVCAADWIAGHFGCANRHCGHPDYKRAEADLHNLWPAIGAINSSRGDKLFGESRDPSSDSA